MSKQTNENLIEKKLEYIGLDLSNIPEFLTKYEPLNFRTIQSYDEKSYKVYRHIDVQDIQILITPTDRLADLKERYKLASPLFTYLDEKDEKNIEKFAMFLKMLTNLKISKIEEIEEEQEKLKESLPTNVKYQNHFIWQIYYSDYTKKYFMLVPTNEQDNSALFYLLKKQIESRESEERETIFVPVSHLDYSGTFLGRSEIADVENYLWYFTKDWVSVYEVYDINNRMNIKIVGNTNIYEKIKSDYVITLQNKEESIKFYKLLKAMFILSTATQGIYKFNTSISNSGQLQFIYKNKAMAYEDLAEFIKQEYIEKTNKINKVLAENKKTEKTLKKFNILIEELTKDYLVRQKQITTFLECKKSFFGRVKYYFKKKKDIEEVKKPAKIEREKENSQTEEKDSLYEEKEQYTIEDLINICAKLDELKKKNINIKLDIQAIENKKDILSKKIDNADLYLKEIDEHKKSIFEFWKFTSKDEIQTLNEGENKEETKKDRIERYFDYETDLDDLGKIVDELQRRKLSKNETDAIFAAKQVIKSIKEIEKTNKDTTKNTNNNILEKDLKKLKEEYTEDLEYINMKDFDIFGNMSDDKTKIKMIHNEKHREIEKDKYKILNINLDTEIEVYRDNLQHYYNLITEALNKIKSPYNMSIYKKNSKKDINGINIFNINPQNILDECSIDTNNNIILCKVNIKENMPIIFYTNIIFYDNFNKTLPLGMNLSSEVLVDLDKIKTECIKTEEFNINYPLNAFEVMTKKVIVYEYNTTDIM